MRLVRLFATLLALLSAGPAFAHASLISAHPGEGVVIDSQPHNVQLRFNEPVTPIVMRLIDARGNSHSLTTISRGDIVEALLPDGLPEGTQVLSYRVVSADGHPVGASLQFSIGRAGAAQAGIDASTPRAVAIWFVAALVLVLGLGGVGAAFSIAFLAPRLTPAARNLATAALAIGALAILSSVGIQGLDLLDLPPGALIQAATWATALASSFGLMAGGELVAVLLALASLRIGSARARWLAGLALLCLALARTASGHASTADPVWLTRPAVFLHAASAAAWAGALPVLLWLALAHRDAFPRALRLFATAAVLDVGILLVTGLLLAAIQLGSLSALLDAPYGRLLAAKILLVAALLGLAAWNRWIASPLVASGDGRGRRWLMRTIALEIALVVAVLGIVAGWRLTPPPRVLTSSRPTEMLHLHGARMMAMVQFEPGHQGENKVRIDLLTPEFDVMAAREVVLGLAAPDLGIERREILATGRPDGVWRIPSVYLPAPGLWTVTVDALITDFDKVSIEGSFRLPP